MPTLLPIPVKFSDEPVQGGVAGLDIGMGQRLSELAQRNIFDDNLGQKVMGAYELGAKQFGIGQNDENNLMLTPEEANKDYGIEGQLSYDKPVRLGFARERFERKQRENEFKLMMSTNRGVGAGEMGLQFGTAVATSFLDPMEAALNFMPVYGEAKFLKYLAKPSISAPMRLAGKAGIGAAAGLEAGIVGEPFRLLTSAYEGSDYGLENSAYNLAVSTVFGGVMRGGIGSFEEVFSKLHRNTQKRMIDAYVRASDTREGNSNSLAILDLDPHVNAFEAKVLKDERAFDINQDLPAFSKFLDETQKQGGLSGDLNDIIAGKQEQKLLDLRDNSERIYAERTKEVPPIPLTEVDGKPIERDFGLEFPDDARITEMESKLTKLEEFESAKGEEVRGEVEAGRANFDAQKKDIIKTLRVWGNCFFQGLIGGVE